MTDATALLQSVSVTDDRQLCLLFEGGAQTPEAFAAFQARHSAELYSLYLHPQLAEARNYGPWLLEIKHKDRLADYMATTAGVTGAIVSTHPPDVLARQLASGCSIITPEGTTALVRFYARHVLSILAQQNGQEWHALLFNGITQWWVPAEESWQPTDIAATSEAKNAHDRIIRLNDAIWQQIADKPEVSSILAQWQKLPASQHFTPCVQRSMVINALDKARAAGVTTPLAQKIVALCYLSGDERALESAEVKKLLPGVKPG